MITEEIFACEHLGIQLHYSKTDIIDGDGVIHLISHDSLKDILLNQIPKDVGIKYTFDVIKTELDHSVVKCVITDDLGRRIETLGESTTATLINEISRNYPTTMAKKRAFDQAVIDYIGMKGKVYSDLQIDNIVNQKDCPVVKYSFDEEVSADTIITTDCDEAIDEHNNITVDNNTTVDTYESTTICVEGEDINKIGDTIFNLTGKYRGQGYTISQIYSMDYKYFCNIIKLVSKSEEIQKQVDLMKKYKELKEA